MFEIKDLTEDKTFIFILCYVYNLNMTHVMKLYDLSKEMFKSYLKAFQPMLRLSNTKLITLRTQAIRVYHLVTGKHVSKPRETDLQLAHFLSRHIGRGFTDNITFVTLEDLKDSKIKLIGENDERTDITYDELVKNCKNVQHIEVDGKEYFRTALVSFLLCKYFENTNSKEILNLHLADLHKMLEEARTNG